MGNILVLGNGFDLYHGLKTRYYDFVQFVKNPPRDTEHRIKQICNQNTFLQYFIKVCEINDNWIDCEEEIERVVLLVQKIMDNSEINHNGIVDLMGTVISDVEFIIMRELKRYGTASNKRGFRFKNEYIKNNVIDKMKILQDFRKELDEVIEALSYYLKKELSQKDDILKFDQISNIDIDVVINFNYTPTYSMVYCNETPVFYQHGKLDDNESIVLGIPDNDKISLDFVYFKKYFQRIQKRSGILNKVMVASHKILNGDVTSYFLGMCMGKTDEDLIKQIMDVSTKSVIFYYDQTDYEGKVVNLIDILGRKKLEECLNQEEIEFIKLSGE